MNHIADANKMVSDTPRTTDRVVFIDGNPWVNAPFARELERELNAANDRIKRLEDIINRAHLAFFSDSSDRKVSIAMHRILDEEVRKEVKP